MQCRAHVIRIHYECWRVVTIKKIEYAREYVIGCMEIFIKYEMEISSTNDECIKFLRLIGFKLFFFIGIGKPFYISVQ